MDQKTSAPLNMSKQAPAKPKVVVEAYTFRKDGWPRIRRAAITFGIVLLVGIALVTICRLILLRTEPATASAQAKQTAASDKYRQAESERIEIRDFLPKFEQLRTRGFVGEEKRLDMIDAIKSIQVARRLLPINYDFAPQQTVIVDPTLLAPPLELRATKVSVRMGLLHELDLVHFMADLKARGFYVPKECILTTIAGEGITPLAPRLTADCTLYWLTIAETAPAAPDAVPDAPAPAPPPAK